MLELTGLTLVVVGFVVVYVPRLFLLQRKELSGGELAVARPDMTWIRFGYPSLSLLWLAIVTVAHFVIWRQIEGIVGDRVFGMFGSFLASISAFEGLFAASTGVYSVSTRFRYLYVREDGYRLRLIGVSQVILALAIILCVYIFLSQ